MIIENILSQYSQSLSFIIEIIYQFTYKQHPVFYMRLTCNQHSSWPGPVAAVESLDRAVSRSVAPLEALGARRRGGGLLLLEPEAALVPGQLVGAVEVFHRLVPTITIRCYV